MKVLHVNAGLETGGGLFHLINLLTEAKKNQQDFTLLTFADGPVAEAARKNNLNVKVLAASSRYDRSIKKKLAQFINDENFDLVNSHGPRANLYMDQIKGKITAKWVITIHSNPLLDFSSRGMIGKIFTNLNVKSIKQADHLLAITEKFKGILVEQLQIKPGKISVIYNGVAFHDEVSAKIPHAGFNLVNVARMEPGKGQDILLESLAKIANNQVKLNLIGAGSQEQNLKDLVDKLKLNDQVTFSGFLNHEQIKHIYQSSDLAVLTSYSESFPLVLLEAADNLVPIMSTDVGDINKMIPNQTMGFVAKIGDIDSIVMQLKSAVDLPQNELQQMAVSEKDYLKRNFSLTQQLDSIIKIYNKVLEENE